VTGSDIRPAYPVPPLTHPMGAEPVGLGVARHGSARLGNAMQGVARHGEAGHGWARRGEAGEVLSG
jgi:hypothetical protein